MATCATCEEPFEKNAPQHLYCSPLCRTRAAGLKFRAAHRRGKVGPTRATCDECGAAFAQALTKHRYCSEQCAIRARKAQYRLQLGEIHCTNCKASFQIIRWNQRFCSSKCSRRFDTILRITRNITRRTAAGVFDLKRSLTNRRPYTPAEIASLRSDPLCVLPNRTLRAQWVKCDQLSIPRDKSLYVAQTISPAALAHQKARASEMQPAYRRRTDLRRRVRADPEPVLAELRKLARGHRLAEDVVIEGFATVLRLAIPADEAFKLAKAEVNRTSAQPFREQSFNPDIDYEARETGRQMSKASDIRSARGEG